MNLEHNLYFSGHCSKKSRIHAYVRAKVFPIKTGHYHYIVLKDSYSNLYSLGHFEVVMKKSFRLLGHSKFHITGTRSIELFSSLFLLFFSLSPNFNIFCEKYRLYSDIKKKILKPVFMEREPILSNYIRECMKLLTNYMYIVLSNKCTYLVLYKID